MEDVTEIAKAGWKKSPPTFPDHGFGGRHDAPSIVVAPSVTPIVGLHLGRGRIEAEGTKLTRAAPASAFSIGEREKERKADGPDKPWADTTTGGDSVAANLIRARIHRHNVAAAKAVGEKDNGASADKALKAYSESGLDSELRHQTRSILRPGTIFVDHEKTATSGTGPGKRLHLIRVRGHEGDSWDAPVSVDRITVPFDKYITPDQGRYHDPDQETSDWLSEKYDFTKPFVPRQVVRRYGRSSQHPNIDLEETAEPGHTIEKDTLPSLDTALSMAVAPFYMRGPRVDKSGAPAPESKYPQLGGMAPLDPHGTFVSSHVVPHVYKEMADRGVPNFFGKWTTIPQAPAAKSQLLRAIYDPITGVPHHDAFNEFDTSNLRDGLANRYLAYLSSPKILNKPPDEVAKLFRQAGLTPGVIHAAHAWAGRAIAQVNAAKSQGKRPPNRLAQIIARIQRGRDTPMHAGQLAMSLASAALHSWGYFSGDLDPVRAGNPALSGRWGGIPRDYWVQHEKTARPEDRIAHNLKWKLNTEPAKRTSTAAVRKKMQLSLMRDFRGRIGKIMEHDDLKDRAIRLATRSIEQRFGHRLSEKAIEELLRGAHDTHEFLADRAKRIRRGETLGPAKYGLSREEVDEMLPWIDALSSVRGK